MVALLSGAFGAGGAACHVGAGGGGGSTARCFGGGTVLASGVPDPVSAGAVFTVLAVEAGAAGDGVLGTTSISDPGACEGLLGGGALGNMFQRSQ